MAGVNALTCPNCGGAVEVDHAQNGIVHCTYCGTPLQIPELEHPPEPPARPDSPPEIVFQPLPVEIFRQPAVKPARARFAILILAISLFLVISGMVAVFLVLVPQATTLNLRLWNEVVPLETSEKGPPDLIARVEVGDAEEHHLVLLDSARRGGWSGSPARR